MKRLVKYLIILAIFGGLAWGGYTWRARAQQPPNYRFAEVSKGSIVSMVNATGTVQPVLSVSVGAFVSGPIEGVFVDFNATVKKGDLLAKIDPRIYEASAAQARAVMATKKAEVESIKAKLQQARNDESRSKALQKENVSFISATEMDQFRYNRQSLDAQVAVAEASVNQAQASLETAEANLAYTAIRSPVDGIVINRKIDPGQTLASQFQTPELFVVAPDMKTKMNILASVDEADIGLIGSARDRNMPVHFTVDAYPDDLFDGSVYQIRMSSTTTQNVVTYPVVVTAPNPDLKLMPGMTANLSFQVSAVKDVLRIPNAALRYFPKAELVRPEDRKLLIGAQSEPSTGSDETGTKLTADQKAQNRKERNKRYVWIVDGDFLKAIPVITGESDNRFTRVVSGEVTDKQQLVSGIRIGE